MPIPAAENLFRWENDIAKSIGLRQVNTKKEIGRLRTDEAITGRGAGPVQHSSWFIRFAKNANATAG